nr:uncharacterized protein LOC126055284 [Helicoverpa armigera]
MLAERFFLKIISSNSHLHKKLVVDHRVSQSISCNISASSLIGGSLPGITTIFYYVNKNSKDIAVHDIWPMYKIPFPSLINNFTVHLDVVHNKFDFSMFIDNKPDNYIIYTDGSKTDHNVRAAFYDPQLDFTKCIKLNAACSVFTAESYAIYCALQHAISVNNVHTILIVSDSKSVLSALNNVNMSFKLNYILYEIRVKTKQLLDKFINVEFVWVPSHSGIPGNEIADAVTHWEHYDDQTELVKVPFSDYHSHIKEINRKLWNDYWTLTLENKGKWYADIQKELRRKPWFNNCEYINRRFITTITRMRLGHCLTPAHLNRINVYNDSRCKYCDAEVADLDHIVLKCANFNIQRLILVSEICECEEIQQSVPRQVQELLANKKFYKTLYKYINNTVEKI